MTSDDRLVIEVIRSSDQHDAKDRAHVNAGGVLCAQCGMRLEHGATICRHHYDDPALSRWAKNNQMMCDLFHRGIEPRRLEPTERYYDTAWSVV